MITEATENLRATAFGRPVTWHSQPETEQDKWVLRTLAGKERGTFLEVGAYDGVYHSNTLCLEQHFGWTGWLVEAMMQYAAKAQWVRRAKIINLAVGPDERTLPFFVGGQWSGLKDYTRPNLLPGHATYHNPLVNVPTVPLQKILRLAQVPAVIDYLSIDVEGAEYPILKSYFADPPAMFRCMTVEVGLHQDHLPELCDLLRPLGYRLDMVQAWEAYFTHDELCYGKSHHRN
jgi:FkbM family methyltransferase